jgi:diguanylate cyclase (GGDEF)-like protein
MLATTAALQAACGESSEALPLPPAPHATRSAPRSDGGRIGVVLAIVYLSLLFAALAATPRLKSGLVPAVFVALASIGLLIHLELAAQRKLMREVALAAQAAAHYAEALEQYSFIDPTTGLLNRKYLDQLFTQQIRWINRTGSPATLLAFEVVADGQPIASEHLMAEAARLLRSNFRGSDYIVCSAGKRFVVLLPETTGEQAQFALARLVDKVDHWNLEYNGSAMMLHHAVSVCSPGGDLWAALEQAEAKLCCDSAPCVPS